MKQLKKYLSMLALAALAFGAASCSDSDDYTPGPEAEGAQVTFVSNGTNTYTVGTTTSSVSVELVRSDVTGSINVPIVLTTTDPADATLFSAPATVNFADGANKTKCDITFDRDALADGTSYDVTLSIDDPTITTIYGAAKMTITIKVPEPYVLLGKGTFREDCMTTLYAVDNVVYEVEIYENIKNPGYIYLKNAYTSLYPYNDPGDYVEEDTYFAVRIEPANQVYVPKQFLGLDWGKGEFFLGTIAYGTYDKEKGIITFPERGLMIGYGEEDYAKGSGYYANTNAMFRITMPGAVLTDYSLDAAYAGFSVDADNTTAYPAFNVAYGADVASINYALFDGDITADYADAVASIIDGSTESVSYEVSGSGEDKIVSEDAYEAGVYTIVIVPANADGEMQADDAIAVSFYFSGVGAAETPECDITCQLVPFTELFGTDRGSDDSEAMGYIMKGSELKSVKYGLFATASIEKALQQGATIEEIAIKNCSSAVAAENLNKLNEGSTIGGGFTKLTAGTSYTLLVVAENIYGNTKVVSSSLSTEEAAALARAAKLSWKGIPTLSNAMKFDSESRIIR